MIAGGHSLLPMMKLRLATPEYLVDINDLHDSLSYIEADGDVVRIGAMTRHRELLESELLRDLFPIFRDAERVIADPPVRNRGTLGGALCQADPSEDLSSVCTTLDAVCVIQGSSGTREVPMDRLPPRALRDRRRPRRAADRGTHPGPRRTAAAPTSRSTGVPATGPSSPPGAAVWLEDGLIVDARVGLAAVGPNTTGIPEVSASPARAAARGRACSPRPAGSLPPAADRSPTPAAPRPTSVTSPTS